MRLYFAEVFEAAVNFLCVLTWHFGGCRVSYWWLNTRLGRWSLDTLEANRYPEYRGTCDGCAKCGQKYRQSIPNPYYATEHELAEWARWYGSDVSPKDYAAWLRENPQPDNRVTSGNNLASKTIAWTFCPNCKTGSLQTFDSNVTR